MSLGQWCTDTTPVVQVGLALDDVGGVVPLALADVGPLVAAITKAAEVAR